MIGKLLVSLMILLMSDLGLQAAEQPLYKDAGQPIPKRVADLLGRMTLEEKVQLVTGNRIPADGVIGSVGIARLGVPNFKIEHGPYAFKGWFLGEGGPKQTGTYFPVSIAQASTWDRALVEEINAAMGAEMKASGGQANAGPAMNIIRDPRGGRSFEYFTEDPYLNGQIATAYTKGLQSQKVFLKPGETKTVTLELDKSSFAFFSEQQGNWVAEPGEFELLIGRSSREILQKAVCRLK